MSTQPAGEIGKSKPWTIAGLVKLVSDNRRMLESLQSRLNEFASTPNAHEPHLYSVPERLRQLELDVQFSLETNKRLADSLARLRDELTILKSDDGGCRQVRQRFARPKLGRSQLSDTVFSILDLLGKEGAKTARQVSKAVGKSREHTARVMAQLVKDGVVVRVGNRVPAQYLLTEEGRNVVDSSAEDVVPRQYARGLPDVRPSSNGSRPL